MAETERAYQNLVACKFLAVYLKSSERNGRPKLEGFVWEKQLFHTFKWFSIQTLVNLQYFVKHYGAQKSFLIHNREKENIGDKPVRLNEKKTDIEPEREIKQRRRFLLD